MPELDCREHRNDDPDDYVGPNGFADMDRTCTASVSSVRGGVAPRKVQTPSTATVVVIGDTFGDWLGYGLEQALAETPEIGIVRKIKPDLSLARDNPRLDAPEWSQALKDLLATEKPSAIVVMLGVSDRLPLRDRVSAGIGTPIPPDSDHPAAATTEAQRRPPSGNYEFHTDKWAELYSKRIDDMIAALKTKAVPIVWVGLPAIRGAKSTSDMSYLDGLYRARAEKAGINYVDIWDGFVDEQGLYTQQGPDFEGQTRRLRTYDGVYFTKAGAEKLGHYVEHELQRVLTDHVLPVALPGPEEQSPAKGAALGRPAIGPVVPLSATSGGEGGELLGAASHPTEQESDPLATRVLKGGDAIAAPHGRTDDFSWPRADTSGSDAADGPAPATPANGSASNNGVENENKNDTNKAETKKINRNSRSCSRLRTISRRPSRSVPATERPVGRPYRSAPLFPIQGEDRFPIGMAKHYQGRCRSGRHQLSFQSVHTGEVELAEDDVRGIAVHIASRVARISAAPTMFSSRAP